MKKKELAYLISQYTDNEICQKFTLTKNALYKLKIKLNLILPRGQQVRPTTKNFNDLSDSEFLKLCKTTRQYMIATYYNISVATVHRRLKKLRLSKK